MSQNDDNKALAAKLNALSAYVESFDEGPDAALVRLQGKTDPESIKRQLEILVDAERWSDAVQLMGQVPTDIAWVDRVIASHVQLRQLEEARRLIEWVKASGGMNEWHRSILTYVDHAYRRIVGEYDDGKTLRPDTINPQTEAELRDVVSVAKPVRDLVAARGHVDNELEGIVLELTVQALSLLRDTVEAGRVAVLLATRKPIPLIVARLMLARVTPADTEIVQRLRVEHPNEFEPRVIACLIEGQLLGKPADAFGAAMRLVGDAGEEGNRVDLAKVLIELAQPLGAKYFASAEEATGKLLGVNHPFFQRVQLLTALATGRLNEAEAILTRTRDDTDPHWLQAYASYQLRRGGTAEAIASLSKAAELLPHQDIIRQLAGLAFEHGYLDVARGALERLSDLLPGAKDVLHNLSLVYARQEDWTNAARLLEELRKSYPSPANGLNSAIALARSGNLKASLAVYDDLCAVGNPQIQAILGRAHLLRTMGQVQVAWQSIESARENHWDDPTFVGTYLDLAFAAGEDHEGHSALLQLKTLQELGKASPDVLQTRTLDDLTEHIRNERNTSETVSRQVQEGKLPWLMADSMSGLTSYWGWRVRTQALDWLSDAPETRSQRTIYSTNSFSVRETSEGRRLEEIELPPKGTAVVIDLSSLITLQQLGLLGMAADYFGKVLYPSAYLTLRLYEAERMVLHQLSRRRAFDHIKSAVDSSRLTVTTDIGLPENRPMPYVMEYTLPEDQEKHYTLADVTVVLYEGGFASEDERKKLIAVAHRLSQVGKGLEPLSTASAILINLSTLETIDQLGMLDAVLRAFRVHISRKDYDEVFSSLAGIVVQDQVRGWYMELWEQLQRDTRFVPALHRVPDEWNDERLRGIQDQSLASAFLALGEGASLFADDRVCQSYVLNQRKADRAAAFGTDSLLEGLAEVGLIDWERAADGFLKLASFRYRFLLPSKQILLVIVKRFRGSLPGRELRAIGAYIHDCMRDGGLFAGFEPTLPPTTLANRLYQSWVTVTAETIATVWTDRTNFTELEAEKLTTWALLEFLPSPPRSMGPNGRVMCAMTASILISRMLFKLTEQDDYELAHRCIERVRTVLGLSGEDVIKIVSEVIDAI